MNVPDHLQQRVAELISIETDGADKKRLWAVVMGLVPYVDGNQWCVCAGDNIQAYPCAFGDSPADAMNNFEHAMYRSITETHKGAAK